MRGPVRVDRRRRLWRGWGVGGTRRRSSRVDCVPSGLGGLGLPRLLSLPRLPGLYSSLDDLMIENLLIFALLTELIKSVVVKNDLRAALISECFNFHLGIFSST